jgi:Ca-activated chloride channel homolog
VPVFEEGTLMGLVAGSGGQVRGVHVAAALTISMLLAGIVAAAQNATFRAETRLVVLHATVRNSRGELIKDLEKDAFTVYENGKPQPITLFHRDDVPVSIGLLIDNSGSMQTLRPRVEAAALAFVRASHPLDEVFVVNFAARARVDVPMTNDIGVLEKGISAGGAIGGTALRDAVILAQNYLSVHASHDRRVLLLITDGNDSVSMASTDQVRQMSGHNETSIFAIGLFADRSAARRGRRELEQITDYTGGVTYAPASIDQIESVALQIAHEIRNQYTIAYTPLDQTLDGRYRTIQVRVAGAGRGLSVRTRAGYWATGSSSTGQ